MQGIQHRVIVRPGIIIHVDRGDGDLHHGDMMALTVEKHVRLVFIPAAGNHRESSQAGGWDYTQPGLGILERDPAQPVQEKGHGPVSAFAFGRHLRTGKVPAA